MKILADESVDGPVVARLRADGHDVRYVAELAPGLPDDDVLDQAHEARSVLLTADRDFGELVYRLRQASAGVVLLRLAGCTPEEKAVRVSRFFAAHEAEAAGAFAVVSIAATRIRRSP